MRTGDIIKSRSDLLCGRIYENFGDSLARERPVKCRGFRHGITTRTPKRIGTVVVRRDKAVLGDPVDRFQLLRGDECLRTRKQTHQLRVHVPPKTTKDTNDNQNERYHLTIHSCFNPAVPFHFIHFIISIIIQDPIVLWQNDKSY